MATLVRIKGTPQPEPIIGTGLAIWAPGRSGTLEELDSGGFGGRALGDPLPFGPAAAATGGTVVTQVAISLDPPPLGAPVGGRAMGGAQPQLIVPKDPELDYVALHTDESGATHWVLPNVVGETAVFELPEGDTAAPDTQGGRGAITKAVRVVVRVVAWAAKPVLGAGALSVATAWERTKRPYGWWQLTPAGEFVEPDWDFFNIGPTLLLVHGTFSTPQAGFAGWVGTESCNTVLARYANRCLAIAHPSLSASPGDNFGWLARELSPALHGYVDVVCHSRGGLVARVLAGEDRLNIRRICQVGAPNLGTPLAHAQHWITFLDGHTRWLTALPDTVSTILLEGVLAVMKLIATGAGAGLPGIASMDPEGEYLVQLGKRALNKAQWFTIGADYRPDGASDPLRLKRAADRVVDRFFAEPNDLVVPAQGCHLPGPAVSDSLRLQGSAVHHCNYFESAAVHAKLAEWLQ